MALPFSPPLEPMLALVQDAIPEGDGWLYEPKWDGFRAIVFRDGDSLEIQSRKLQPLNRYFPELLQPLKEACPENCIVDGEIIVAGPNGLEFDALQQRIHPAASRVNKLAVETPAQFVAFDLLALGEADLRETPFGARRQKLEQSLKPNATVFLTPQTKSFDIAQTWFREFEEAGLDGIIAKPVSTPYTPGERTQVKVKHRRTADCVVGGFRRHKDGQGIGSLLLGLYDENGVLHHVGHTSSFSAQGRKELLQQLLPMVGGESFGKGRTPGTPSRWTSGKDSSYESVTPTLVCEVSYDYLQGERFRHATTFMRWRTDKAPEACTYTQLLRPTRASLEEMFRRFPSTPS
jgi:ATP-dependent DNA ligase